MSQKGHGQFVVDISTHAHVGSDGTLKVEVSTDLRDTDVAVRLLVEEVAPSTNENGAAWPQGFFEETYGSLSEDPLNRLPQGEYDSREVM